MSFADYTTFRVEVADWIARGDVGETTSTGKVDSFIDLFESEWNATNRTRQMETETTITMTGTGYLTHPSDWLGWKNLSYTYSGRRYNLEPFTEQNANFRVDQSGIQWGFKVVGDKTYIVNAPSALSVLAVYWAQVPALSNSNTSNWLLAAYPGVYLTGVKKYAARWLKDPQMIAECENDYAAALAIVTKASELANMGGQILRPQPDRWC